MSVKYTLGWEVIKLNIYDVYYRLKGDKDAPVLCKSFTAPTKESAKTMAKGVIGKEYMIIEIKMG